jgi:hypothetical protein
MMLNHHSNNAKNKASFKNAIVSLVSISKMEFPVEF